MAEPFTRTGDGHLRDLLAAHRAIEVCSLPSGELMTLAWQPDPRLSAFRHGPLWRIPFAPGRRPPAAMTLHTLVAAGEVRAFDIGGPVVADLPWAERRLLLEEVLGALIPGRRPAVLPAWPAARTASWRSEMLAGGTTSRALLVRDLGALPGAGLWLTEPGRS